MITPTNEDIKVKYDLQTNKDIKVKYEKILIKIVYRLLFLYVTLCLISSYLVHVIILFHCIYGLENCHLLKYLKIIKYKTFFAIK